MSKSIEFSDKLSWEAVNRETVFRGLDGQWERAKKQVIMNDKTGKELWACSKDYHILTNKKFTELAELAAGMAESGLAMGQQLIAKSLTELSILAQFW